MGRGKREVGLKGEGAKRIRIKEEWAKRWRMEGGGMKTDLNKK